ncbi:hypothetical protein DENIS_2300 [Desulfonema ishimotonii]|uniref:FecR protein domain-containing protein n=1 Tax=Desulfonema ishimotonii TaxID=45657 RepID=A0A401FWJ9_9BACT|nr:FecR domain-containing protein [Desulfonema ishimotonii]GBC61340.1 hypothetical protein DENIS_2300 [Desulfonema ishimotonii]
MRYLNKQFIRTGCVMVFLLLGGASSGIAQSMLPDGLVMDEEFQPGTGAAVGKVKLVQGDVILVHAEFSQRGYMALRGIPLFKGDTVITQENSRVSLMLNDGSVLTLAHQTRLVISESIYDPERTKSRSSFIRIAVGKVRLLVRKLADFQRSDFRVKTKTAIVGVRGSDFIVAATETATQVTALENTDIEVIGLVTPCEKYREGENIGDCYVAPMILTDFEHAVIEIDELPEKLGELLPADIELMKRDFIIRPDADKVRLYREEVDIEKGIFVPDTSLIRPETVRPEVAGSASVPDIFKNTARMPPEPKAVADELRDEELKKELDNIRELPDFPETPDNSEPEGGQ